MLLSYPSDIALESRSSQPERSTPPVQRQARSSRAAEFAICDQTIETIFRDTKQVAGLAACQGWVDQVMVRHVALVCLTFVALQLLRRDPQETVGAVKARWHDEVLRDGQTSPQPLRSTPPAFRHKLTA